MGKTAASAPDQVPPAPSPAPSLSPVAAARTALPGISHRAYAHPAALAALAALRRSAGLDAAVRELRAAPVGPAPRQRYLAAAIRTGPRQLGCLHAIAADAAATLDLAEVPELYVRGAGDLTAVTLGVELPFIVLGAGLLDLMTEPELRFIVGRELGHALAGHAPYATLAAREALAGEALAGPLVAGLRRWRRAAALSGDRAGLLAAQDPAAALRALLKLAVGPRAAELDMAGVLAQAAELRPGPASVIDVIGAAAACWPAVAAVAGVTGEAGGIPPGAAAVPADDPHPMLVFRAAELDRWVRSGGYARIVAEGAYETRADDGLADVCDLLRGHRGTPRQTPLARTTS
jgi:Zn-dependent protease with chaperone function